MVVPDFFCAISQGRAADAVPIYERPKPTDPVELKKCMEEMERALKEIDAAVKKETAKNTAAILAAPTTQARSVDVAIHFRSVRWRDSARRGTRARPSSV